MTLRFKLSLVIIIDIIVTLAIVGFLSYTRSKEEIEKLALDLVKSRVEYAYTLCREQNALEGTPNPGVKSALQRVKIAEEGYIFVFSNSMATRKQLLIHPANEGRILADVPYIDDILSAITSSNYRDGFSNYISYQQTTSAKGRQGEKKIGYYIYFAPWNWVIVASGYERDIYGRTEVLRQRVIQGILIVGIFSLIVANLFVVRMFRPMRHLIAVTKDVAGGNLDAKIDIKSKDEIGGLADHFNYMLSSLKENTRVWQELQIARRLQNEMLPAGHPQLPGVTIEASSIPATEVGGDFYDFIPLDENRFVIIVGDVSGKGISGAIGMSSSLSALRFASDERTTTAEILELANKRLVKDIQNHMFVAVFIAIYDKKERKLFYTNAGQTMPIIQRGEHVDFLKQSAADRFPLGIRPDVTYEQQEYTIQPGDQLICYTDGIIEINDHKMSRYEPYGFDRFKQAIRNNTKSELPEMLRSLIVDAEKFSNNSNHPDDITLVIIRFA